jgi:hypothetical protein
MGFAAPSKVSFRSWIESYGEEKLAERFEVTGVTIRNWKMGYVFPRPEHMREIRKLSKGLITYDIILDKLTLKTG